MKMNLQFFSGMSTSSYSLFFISVILSILNSSKTGSISIYNPISFISSWPVPMIEHLSELLVSLIRDGRDLWYIRYIFDVYFSFSIISIWVQISAGEARHWHFFIIFMPNYLWFCWVIRNLAHWIYF